MAKARNERTYIKVHDGMPDHPKIGVLSDAGFRHLVTLWCWCSRHLTDGHVPEAMFRKMTTERTRKELVGPLATKTTERGGYLMHDYLDHQRSAEEVRSFISARSASGLVGNHRRWHVERGISDDECPLCIANGIAPVSQKRSPTNRESDRKEIAKRRQTTDSRHIGGSARARASQVPEDWRPSEPSLAWLASQEHRERIDAERETAKFIDHHRSRGTTFKNVDLAWKNWMRRAIDWAPQRNGSEEHPRVLNLAPKLPS